MHPEVADELVAKGRAQALRGEVKAAVATFEVASVKGSEAGAYLRVILGACPHRQPTRRANTCPGHASDRKRSVGVKPLRS